MGTLQSKQNPASRIEAGDHVLAAAESLGKRTKPIEARLTRFATAHSAYSKADTFVKKADNAVRAQQTRAAEADVDQDEGVDRLAVALVGEGMPRLAPFASFDQPPPAQIKRLGHGTEAKAVLRLVASVAKRRPPLLKSRKVAASSPPSTSSSPRAPSPSASATPWSSTGRPPSPP